MSKNEQDPISDNTYKNNLHALRKRALLTASVGGTVLGVGSYSACAAVGNNDALEISTSVFSATVLGLSGVKWKNISLEEAENYRDDNNKNKMRLKLAQAYLEESLFTTLPLGVSGFYLGGNLAGSLYSAIGLGFGARNIFKEWKKRTKEYPDLIIPENNSVVLQSLGKERVNGFKMPPVFTSDSIKDIFEFREENKDIICKWADEIPDSSESMYPSRSVTPLLTSVFILPKVRHYPAFDPESNNNLMVIKDNTEEMRVFKLKYTENLWPMPTVFEKKSNTFRKVEDELWSRWRENSWENKVAIVAQYRKNEFRKNVIKKETVIFDKYFLLDIAGKTGGKREKIKTPQKLKTATVFQM